MSKSTVFAVLAAVVFGATFAATTPAVAEPDKAKPRDYGVTEADRRGNDPMQLGAFVYSQRCKVCHARKSDGKTSYGPHLEGIYGRKAGATGYGEHTAAMAESGVIWDEQALDALLKDPQKVMPGTKMDTVVRFPRSRKALIAYLKTL